MNISISTFKSYLDEACFMVRVTGVHVWGLNLDVAEYLCHILKNIHFFLFIYLFICCDPKMSSGKYPWKRYEPPYPPSHGLNSTTAVLLGEWLWHLITYKSEYATRFFFGFFVKQRNQTKPNLTKPKISELPYKYNKIYENAQKR